MSHIPDLVQDTKLDTAFVDGYTVHHHDESDDDAYTRSVRRVEYWETTQFLARGGCGEVFLQKCTQGKRRYEWRAVKVIPVTNGKIRQKNYISELETIAKFSQRRYSKCFVKLLGWYDSADSLFITMEYFPLGDLQKYMSENEPIPEKDVQEVTYQVLEGLQYMHQEGFAHRDIKPGNVMIKSRPPDKWWVKLSDFGISKRIDPSAALLSTMKGTTPYMAPELFGHEPGGSYQIDFQAADMWSLGELVFRMLTKKATFPTHLVLFRFLARPDLFPSQDLVNAGASQESDSFIRSVMKPTPETRLQARHALDHPWIRNCKMPGATVTAAQLYTPMTLGDGLPISGVGQSLDPWATKSSTSSYLSRAETRAAYFKSTDPNPLTLSASRNPGVEQVHQATSVVPLSARTPRVQRDISEGSRTIRPHPIADNGITEMVKPSLSLTHIETKDQAYNTSESSHRIQNGPGISIKDARYMTLSQRLQYLNEAGEALSLDGQSTPGISQPKAQSTIAQIQISKPLNIRGKRLYVLENKKNDLNRHVAFTSNSEQLAVSGITYNPLLSLPLAEADPVFPIRLAIHEAHNGNKLRDLGMGQASQVSCMAVSRGPGPGTVAYALSDKGYELWRLPAWRCFLRRRERPVTALAFHPTRNDVFAVAFRFRVQVLRFDEEAYKTHSLTTFSEIEPSFTDREVRQVVWSCNGIVVGALYDDARICLWKLGADGTWTFSGEVTPPNNGVKSFQFNTSSDEVIFIDLNGHVRTIDVKSGRDVGNRLEIKDSGRYSLQTTLNCSPNGQLVPLARYDAVDLYDWLGRKVAELDADVSRYASFYRMEFSRDGKYLAAMGTDSVVVWELEEW